MKRVYFIKPIGMDGPIKIGCSKSPTGRLSTLETWSPFALELLAEIEGGEKLERRFHAKFIAQRKSREWFEWSQELADTIAAIKAGVFDIETLPAPRRLHHGHRTGPAKGTKWTEERRAQSVLQRAELKVTRRTGLVRPPFRQATHEQFMADPAKYGVTREEYQRRIAEFHAKLAANARRLAA